MNSESTEPSAQDSELTSLRLRNAVLRDNFNTLCKEHKVSQSPDALMKMHIANLKKYNELRDTGNGLAQLIANEKDCKIKEVFEEMGYSMLDKQ